MIAYHRELISYLRRLGATALAIRQKHGKHPWLSFTFGGQSYRRPIPATPSDIRSLRNDKASLRRLIERRGTGVH